MTLSWSTAFTPVSDRSPLAFEARGDPWLQWRVQPHRDVRDVTKAVTPIQNWRQAFGESILAT
jgi:hypothetical protein